MKILYLSAYDQPYGQSPRSFQYSVELVKRGHSVTLMTNSFCHFTKMERKKEFVGNFIEFIEGVEVVWLKTRPYQGNGLSRGLNMLDNFFSILSQFSKMSMMFDVVIAPSVPPFTSFAGLIISRQLGVPFVYEVRDVWPEALVNIGGLKRWSISFLIFRYLEKLFYRDAKLIFSTLPFIDDHVENSGASKSKIRWLPNGIDSAPFSGHILYEKQELAAPLIVMYVGGFGLDHDVPTIIQAAKILQDKGDSRFKFILYGHGVRKDICIRMVDSLLLENIEIRGSVSKNDLPSIQAEADILVAAITDSPSFKFGLNLNKLCTYFASARPIVYSGNAPNDPVATSGGGLSVPAEDPVAMVYALIKLANMSPSERAEIGLKGYAYVNEFLGMSILGSKMEHELLSIL